VCEIERCLDAERADEVLWRQPGDDRRRDLCGERRKIGQRPVERGPREEPRGRRQPGLQFQPATVPGGVAGLPGHAKGYLANEDRGQVAWSRNAAARPWPRERASKVERIRTGAGFRRSTKMRSRCKFGEPTACGQRLEHAGAPLQGVLPRVRHLAENRHRQRPRLLDHHGDPGNVDELFQPSLDLLGEHAGSNGLFFPDDRLASQSSCANGAGCARFARPCNSARPLEGSR
jgi:hypothetical protein